MAERPRHPALPDPGKNQPRRPRALTDQEKLRQAPWYPKPYTLADAAAVKAIANGMASPEQQRHGMRFIVVTLCQQLDMAYRPGGEDGRRDTDFALGCQFVGNQIAKFFNMNLADLQHAENADPHEPQS
tara:strand:- start:20938 stop:21324 length:387 start_codon:yes stop_codon:yes gene_type:complete